MIVYIYFSKPEDFTAAGRFPSGTESFRQNLPNFPNGIRSIVSILSKDLGNADF